MNAATGQGGPFLTEAAVIVINKPLLAAFRACQRCQWCGRPTPGGCDPHHLRSRGMGGGSRLDIKINLIALCRHCHDETHAGRILYADLLAKVAARERTTQLEIEEEVKRLRKAPKR